MPGYIGVRAVQGRRPHRFLIEVSEESSIAPAKLRRTIEVLDQAPILHKPQLGLLIWASDYHHHPLGEVVARSELGRAWSPGLQRYGRFSRSVPVPLTGLFVLIPPLARDREHIVRDLDLHVVLAQAGQFGTDYEPVIPL